VLDFAFTPAQERYREALRAFVLRELLPHYQENDRLQRFPREQIRRVIRFADDFWRDREEQRDLIEVAITAEEVARGDFNVVLPSLGVTYQNQFFADLSPEQRHRWVPDLLSGDKTIGLCITEPAAGSDMARLEMRAERKGDGYVLNGVKNSVSFLNADVFYAFARTAPASGWEGISAFLVPRDTPGLGFEVVDDLGCRAVPRGVVRFQNVEVPAEARVGEEGSAFVRISRFFDVNRAVIGLKCIGAALQSIDETLVWAQQRVVFGKPLLAQQGVAFELAESVTELELARWQCYRVLWMRQQGRPCQWEGAMVKWYAPKVAAQALLKCLRFHGHYGYSTELPIQQRLRDVIGWQIGDGSEEVMKLIIARSLAERASALAEGARGPGS
jgi:cyclohexanecarboxyl-CoA dehydrogenase